MYVSVIVNNLHGKPGIIIFMSKSVTRNITCTLNEHYPSAYLYLLGNRGCG